MYLYGQRSASNLGSYLRGTGRLGSLGFRPNQAVQRKVYSFRGRRQPVNSGLRGYRGIGDDGTDPFAGIGPGDLTALQTAPIPIAPTFDTTEQTFTSDQLVDPTTALPTGPTASSAFNVLQENLVQSSSAADYVSPQAAINAGVPAATVNATWATSQGVNSFSSPQAATAALTASLGAAQAAATVAKLWTGGGQAAPSASGSFLTQSTAGIPNTVLIGGGLLVLLLGVMSGGRH
jgi:hypothetical protein